MRLFHLLIAALHLASLSHASPTGAAGCEGGMAAVGGAHVAAENIEDGTLEFGKFAIKVNGFQLYPNTTVEIPIGVTNLWEITGVDAFRGFLLRLDGGDTGADTTAALGPLPGKGGAVQVAEAVCVDVHGVGGVTHRSRDLKPSVTGLLVVDTVSKNMNLDVTVVVENRNQNSAYYYTGYVLHAVEAFQPPPFDGDDENDNDDMESVLSIPSSAPISAPPTALTGSLPTFPIEDDDEFFNELEATVEPELAFPQLESVTPECAWNETCEMCQGDCDSDDDCTGRLACFQRDDWDWTEVPGCEGLGWAGMDYCYDPIVYPDALQTYPDPCSAEMPCGKCKGDCDDDSHCAGELECFQRPPYGNSTVPGCYGLGLAGSDFCFNRTDVENLDDFDFFTNTPTWAPTTVGDSEPIVAEFFEPTSEPTIAKPEEVYNPPTGRPTMVVEDVYYPPSEFPAHTYVPLINNPTTDGTTETNSPPTEHPTPEETPEASFEDTDPMMVPAGPDDPHKPSLVDTVCSAYRRCDLCEGDCDYDSQCTEGLECYPRRLGELSPVPGCEGQGTAGNDYCYAADPYEARPRSTPCTPQNPCKQCQGDCDVDADCGSNLKCFTRENGDSTTIPGCRGTALGDVDYCVEEGAYNVYRNGLKRGLRQGK